MILRLLLLLFALGAAGHARAHESRPLAIILKEDANGRYELVWKTPPSVGDLNAPAISLGAPCETATILDGSLSGRAFYDCAGGLEGAPLTIDWPVYNPSVSALVRVVWRSGEVSTALLPPDIREWQAPPRETFTGVAKSYFVLGVKHILIGIDHILFLAGLLYLARTPRRVLVTVTGFTVAHSITLALVALDVLRVSVPAVEALIALSIVFVAAEIARGNRETIAWRRPIIVASAFGLLHGAGFAAVLGEIGLPQSEKVAALLFFNVGVEAGQLLLVAAAFFWVWLVVKARALANEGAFTPFPANTRALLGYSLGIVSTYWLIERTAAVFV